MVDDISLPRFEMRPLSEDEGEGYLIEFPDFPGCIADGETPDEAMREGADAPQSYRQTLQQLGREIPQSGEVYDGQWRQRVPDQLDALSSLPLCNTWTTSSALYTSPKL